MSSVSPDVIALAILPAILWGFSPIVDKRGMAGGGSSVQASLTVVLVDTTIYWLAIAALLGRSAFAGLTFDVLAVFVLAGLVGTALGRITIFVGVHRVGASLNSAILSARPLFATVFALALLGEPLGPVTAAGVVVLVSGLVLLTVSKGGDLSGWQPRDLLWPLAAAALFAVGNVARRYGLVASPITALEAVAINETAALVSIVAFVFAQGPREVLSRPRRTYGFFATSGVLTAVALLSMMTALDQETGRVAIVDPLIATAPLFTIVFAGVLLRDLERVTKGVVAGAALIVVGAAMITI